MPAVPMIDFPGVGYIPDPAFIPVPRIPARKPGGVPLNYATGQISTPDDDFASSPFVGATCGGVGPRDCPAAADGRIDHLELPACQAAADTIIATVMPLSSAGGAA